MSSRKQWLTVKIANEGYCCPNAYLRLCRARGETPREMAKNIGMSADTIWYHYRKLDSAGGSTRSIPTCLHFTDCMNKVITEIELEKKPTEVG